MSVSEIQATTYERRLKKPSDLVADNIPLVFLMRKKGLVKTINGGRVIWKTARIAQNQFVQRIDPTEEIALGRNDTITAFEYSPKIILVPVMVSVLEMAQNSGDSAFLDLMDERNQTADDSLMNAVEEDLQGDGTGYGGKAFAGIKSYISKTPTLGTYGGVSRVSYSSIRNLVQENVATFGSATDASNIESRTRVAKNQLVKQGGPDVMFAGSDYFNYGADAMSAKQRFTQNKDLIEANFDNYVMEGMPVVLAAGKQFSGLARIGAKDSYLIRLDNFELDMYKGYNFQPIDKRTSFNQLVDVSITLGIGQLVSGGTSLSGVMYDA
jgi:hypothetical protein